MSVRIVPAEDGLTEAIERLRSGKLVAFPTETVYGLGANALDHEAVASIFATKGRPSTNPIIVHIGAIEQARALVSDWPDLADRLYQAFWPGPLTLILPRNESVPTIVTAGGPTVGLRMPQHPIALRLLQESGIPIAAPSANRSEEVSPTTAQHVGDSLSPFVDDLLILDGGPCQVGIESTVLDITVSPPRILRPGMISAGQLHRILPIENSDAHDGVARSPGMMPRHYAPGVPVLLSPPGSDMGGVLTPGDGLITHRRQPIEWNHVTILYLPPQADLYAAGLYRALRQLDESGVKRIVIEQPPGGDSWQAIHDRLRRAATPKESAE